MEKNEYEIMYTLETDYWWYRGLQGLVKQFIEKQFYNNKASLSIMDAGCGTGRMMELLKKYGDVHGFDFSPYATQFCGRRGIKNVRIQDINTWNPEVNQFDNIISLDVLCHKSIPDENEIFSKFFKALKPGGVLLLNLPAFELLKRHHDIAVHTRKRFTQKSTLKQLTDIGFSISFSSYRLPHIFLLMLAQKVVDTLKGKKHIHSDLKPVPKILNTVLFSINKIENFLLTRNVTFPFGGSLFIKACKESG